MTQVRMDFKHFKLNLQNSLDIAAMPEGLWTQSAYLNFAERGVLQKYVNSICSIKLQFILLSALLQAQKFNIKNQD